MRSMASGGSFHCAYRHATQQAFLEAHELAFAYFGGVFRLLRYDNLTSAVKKILRGYQREETTRFVAFRSHWGYEAQFCNAAKGNEKGGVEGDVGYSRRNYLVPIPQARDLVELNAHLLARSQEDEGRKIGDRAQSVGAGMVIETEHLLPVASEGFELGEVSFLVVDGKGCVKARTNWYSTPLRAGAKARVNVLPAWLEVWHEGRCVARHERNYGRGRQVFNLEHYLDVLERKPGALAGSTPLQQWREQGRWPDSYDRLWKNLIQRNGKLSGTREMVELLLLGRHPDFIRGYAIMVRGGSQMFPSHANLIDGFGADYKRRIKRNHPAWVIVYARGEPLQTFGNHVDIDKNVVDAWGIPVLWIHYERTENEQKMAKDAFQNLQELMHTAGAEVLSADDTLSTPGAISHEMGTTRMGNDPKSSVLNGFCQSHDLRNLFVIDGGCWPSATCQNPTETMLAVAWRASDYLAEQLRRGEL